MGLPGSGQPDLSLDGNIDTYLFWALDRYRVRTVDLTLEVQNEIKVEQMLSDEGKLATPSVYNPLKPNNVVRGSGTVDEHGHVSLTLRFVDSTGAIFAIVHAGGKGKDLRDIVIRAVNDLSAQAVGRLTAPPPSYGIEVPVFGVFDQTGGWGAGTVFGSPGSEAGSPRAMTPPSTAPSAHFRRTA